MPLRTTCAFLAAAALGAAALPARDGPGNAVPLINAWLALASADVPEYRADLRLGPAGAGPAQGRRQGVSRLLGAFTYRPKTYTELTPPERLEVLRDPGFRGFLVRARERADIEAGIPLPAPRRDRASPRGSEDFSPAPGEFLRREPLWLVLRP